MRCSKTKKGIGYTSIHLKDLMTAEDMVMEKKFPLKAAQRDSAVYMTVVLRVSWVGGVSRMVCFLFTDGISFSVDSCE